MRINIKLSVTIAESFTTQMKILILRDITSRSQQFSPRSRSYYRRYSMDGNVDDTNMKSSARGDEIPIEGEGIFLQVYAH